MKEMIYKQEREMEILHEGKYNGYDFLIFSIGTHPTAYVRIPKNHKYYGKTYDEITINCHGGLTYTNNRIGNKIGWWIGWDYAHFSDYTGHEYSFYRDGKRWSTEEIFDDVKKVINFIKLQK
jgi:hypothetical protein